MPHGNPDNQIIENDIGGPSSGRAVGPSLAATIKNNVINTEEEVDTNFDRAAEGSNRERASTLDLKSNGR